MGNVICSCMLGEYAEVRLRLSKMLHEEIEQLDSAQEEDKELCEIELKCCRREFFRNPTGEHAEIGRAVVVEADGGYEYGVVYSRGIVASKKMRLKGLEEKEKLGEILRFADEQDAGELQKVQEREPEIRDICSARIKEHGLAMKLVDVELRLDQQKVTVFYTAAHRVDFRSLVKDLAGEFRARIQMTQITTREEARRAHSFGACGCILCCSSWIQKIHTNPFSGKQHAAEFSNGDQHTHNVIGQCNRPKCCLSYSKPGKCSGNGQNEHYPPLGSKVTTVDGVAVIDSIDLPKKEISLRYPANGRVASLSLQEFTGLFVKK